MATAAGHLECLKYITGRMRCGHIDKGVLYAAAVGGHTECVLYLVVDKNVWMTPIIDTIVRMGHTDMLRRLYNARGHTTDWTNAVRRATSACTLAARRGDRKMLSLLCDVGFDWDIGETCAAAAESGSLECLTYLYENGCSWDENTCTAAARGGHLQCLEYAHENGCPWDGRTVYEAASHGHVKCVAYALKNGCMYRDEGACNYIIMSSITTLTDMGLCHL